MTRMIYDVSMSVENGMISWPSDGPVRIERVRSMEDGERLNMSRLDMSAHTGTHIDAPVHFLKAGGGIDTLPLDILMGTAAVVHIPGVKAIGPDELSGIGDPGGVERLLIKTDNGFLLDEKEFVSDYSYITPEGAAFLVRSGVRLVGIDYLSIAAYGSGEAVHRELLGAGIVIIEGLDLREVPAGTYSLTALPVRIAGCDGAPARVLLREIV